MSTGVMGRKSAYGDLVGTKILNIGRDRRAIEVDYLADHKFTNRIGTLAGGILAGLLDSVTGLVANLELPEDQVAVHRSLSVEYLKPAEPGRLTGRGRVVDQAGKEIRSRGELLDHQGNLLATAEATLRVVRWANDS